MATSSKGGTLLPGGRTQQVEGAGLPLPPPWAHPPPQPSSIESEDQDEDSGVNDATSTVVPPWKLLEIKDGVQVAEHELNDSLVTVLGRAEGAVDVLLRHESVSRFHARIAFDASGTAWLRDYGSAHGTFVNKKRVPAESCGKVESNSTARGSRGVVIKPGDVVQLGASTRLLLLEGPTTDQVQKIVLARRRNLPQAQSKARPSTTAATAANTDPEEESDSSHEDDVGSPDDILSMSEDSIPPAHRKLFEKVRAIQHKIENLTTEVERIQRKGDVGLSAGQEKQVQRNEERISQLQTELEDRCHELWQHLRSQHHSASSDRRRAPNNAEDVDDDEVEDRTARQESSVVEFDEDGETEASLLRKYEMLMERSKQVGIDLMRCEQRVQTGKDKVERLQQQGNLDDAFYATNDLELEQERLRKVKREQESIATTLKDVKKMLKVVKPSWKDEAEVRSSMEATVTSPDEASMLPPPMPPPRRGGSQGPVASLPSQTDSSAEFVIPMPPRVAAGVPTDQTGPSEAFKSPPSAQESPTPKRRRVIGPAEPPPTSTDRDNPNSGGATGTLPRSDAASQVHARPTSDNNSKQLPKGARAPPSAATGTLAFLTGALHGEQASSESARRTSAHVMMPAPKADAGLTTASTGSDPQQDVWQPPKDQDGTGITKLNAKFAGRY